MRFVGLSLVILLWSSVSFADWQNTKWGTTLDSFVKASGGSSGLIGTIFILPQPYRAGSLASTAALKYRFDSRDVARLFEVYVNFLDVSSCRDFEKYLLSRYGSPSKQEANNKNRTLKWASNSEGSNLEFTFSSSLCNLKYLPLESAEFITETFDKQGAQWPTTIESFVNGFTGGTSLIGKQLTVERPYQTGSLLFTERLKFQFDHTGVARFNLVQLLLKDAARCGELSEHLFSKYGAPIGQETTRTSRRLKWRDNAGGNNIELYSILDINCDLTYSPLDTTAGKGL